MSAPILSACPVCGTGVPAGLEEAGQSVPCPGCGHKVLVQAPAPSVLAVPPGPRPGRFRQLAPAVGLAVLLLAGGEYWYLQSRQDERTAAMANQLVRAKVEAAQANMSQHRWNEALLLLREALAIERATNHEEARSLLPRAQQGQATALLEAADKAVREKSASQALALLRDYLGHPQATETERAKDLRRQIEWAASDAEAAGRLAKMSDQELALFAAGGPLAGDDPLRDEGVREIFKDTLRRNLPREVRKREVKRQAERAEAERLAALRQRQEARARDTLAYRNLYEFAQGVYRKHREQRELAARQEKALAQLFDQLGVNDPDEQAQIREGLREKGETVALAQSVARKRDEVKAEFRRSKASGPDDQEAFDRVVDQLLDHLLKELKKP